MLSLLLAAGLAYSPVAYTYAPIPPPSFSRHEGASQILHEHNSARREVGSPPLVWSNQLARESQSYANRLAREGVFRHSSYLERPNIGENLWMGSTGYFSPRDMIRSFLSERQYFRYGRFPNVSRTGDWSHVGHYTQIVWRDTRQVGCGLAEARAYAFLVCRYWPSGNMMGRHPF